MVVLKGGLFIVSYREVVVLKGGLFIVSYREVVVLKGGLFYYCNTCSPSLTGY